jgi:hypothetical protein
MCALRVIAKVCSRWSMHVLRVLMVARCCLAAKVQKVRAVIALTYRVVVAFNKQQIQRNGNEAFTKFALFCLASCLRCAGVALDMWDSRCVTSTQWDNCSICGLIYRPGSIAS